MEDCEGGRVGVGGVESVTTAAAPVPVLYVEEGGRALVPIPERTHVPDDTPAPLTAIISTHTHKRRKWG